VKWLSTDIYGTSSKILREYAVFPDHYRRQRVLPVHCAFEISRFSGEHDENKRRLCTSLGWPADTKIVLFAGRLDQSTQLGHPNNHKNSAFALEVLYAINDPSVRMVMAGANHYALEAFQALINEKNLDDRVKLLGVRSDMAHLMLAADVLLFPSRAEGMGMVAVEAQAAGLPVLASSVVPDEIVVIPELVAFRNLEDSFPIWAETLLQMLARRTRQSTENDGRWSLSGFNIEVCCRQLTQLYLPQSQVV
jgi:glycosyltransferase involved in cell wall biosynthesis